MRTIVILFILILLARTSDAQQLDTTVSWKDYSRIATAHVAMYPVENDKKRSAVLIIDELGENRGSPATDDARFVVQKIARDFGIDPVNVYWVFRWTQLSFDSGGASEKTDSTKELLIMATMGRSKTKTLTGPSWKIINRERLLDLTDRQWHPFEIREPTE